MEMHMATPLQTTHTAVVGYFATGDAAHRAINALVDSGFSAAEIGAAFHVGSSSAGTERTANVGGSLREEMSTNLAGEHGGKISQSNSLSSAASGTGAVQFGVLGPGSGTPSSGAHKPGPISGSDLSNTGLPSELKSTLPHEADLREDRAGASWSSRLEPVFRSSHETAKAAPTKESQNFGTGEGSMNLTGTVPYSQEYFERSFSGYGLESEHARSLSTRIGHGGAVITVHTAERSEEAERILEANGGLVRFSPESGQEGYDEPHVGDPGVEVFGTLGRDYPSRVK
jgi:hypothetical protein